MPIAPVITRLSAPAEIIGLDLIAEFIGLDQDIDANQDKVLPVLRSAAIEQGEQITGAVWGGASYRIDDLVTSWPEAGIPMPLSPVFEVTAVEGVGCFGAPVAIDPAGYTLIPAAIDLGRPWALLRPVGSWPSDVQALSVTCTAGWAANTLPESIRNWALIRIATLYDNRLDAVTGTIATSMPRDHALGLLDRWTVRGNPYAVG